MPTQSTGEASWQRPDHEIDKWRYAFMTVQGAYISATDAEEVRSYNEKTGAEKGVKLARYDLIPIDPLRILAEHYGKGAAKYAERNWELGIDWSKLYAAAMRHLTQFWAGEDTDPETGTPHVISAAWMCFALCQMMIEHPELDDRPSVSRQRDRTMFTTP